MQVSRRSERILSKSLDMQFYDTDDLIKKNTGVEINRIFELEGEMDSGIGREKHSFRLLIKKILLLLQEEELFSMMIILNIKKKKFVFFLKTDINNLLGRLSKDVSRPLLEVSDVKKKLNDLYIY